MLQLNKQTIEFISKLLERELKEEIDCGYTTDDEYTQDLLNAYKDFTTCISTGIFSIIAKEMIETYEQKFKENEEN